MYAEAGEVFDIVFEAPLNGAEVETLTSAFKIIKQGPAATHHLQYLQADFSSVERLLAQPMY